LISQSRGLGDVYKRQAMDHLPNFVIIGLNKKQVLIKH
jgi:hypothetical protein